jgi:hypothetical protein
VPAEANRGRVAGEHRPQRQSASNTPNSDMAIRMPTPNSAISMKSAGRAMAWAPGVNGCKSITARRLLTANRAPSTSGTTELPCA